MGDQEQTDKYQVPHSSRRRAAQECLSARLGLLIASPLLSKTYRKTLNATGINTLIQQRCSQSCHLNAVHFNFHVTWIVRRSVCVAIDGAVLLRVEQCCWQTLRGVAAFRWVSSVAVGWAVLLADPAHCFPVLHMCCASHVLCFVNVLADISQILVYLKLRGICTKLFQVLQYIKL